MTVDELYEANVDSEIDSISDELLTVEDEKGRRIKCLPGETKEEAIARD